MEHVVLIEQNARAEAPTTQDADQDDLTMEPLGNEDKLRLATLNVGTLTNGTLKDVLTLIRFRRLGIIALQDARIAKPRT